MTGASVTPTALVGPEGLEPQSRLHASHDIASAFTPGPWAADSRHSIRISTGKKIATADVWGPSWSDKKANARLIAAAPEMFEALRAAEIALRNRDQSELDAMALTLTKRALGKAQVQP